MDGLHKQAGSREIVELHGSLERLPCTACDHVASKDELHERYDQAGVARCPDCGGVLRPGVVLFGERLPAGVIERSYELAYNADLLLCVGSTLSVTPREEHSDHGATWRHHRRIINQGPTFTDAQLVINDDASQVLPRLTRRTLNA